MGFRTFKIPTESSYCCEDVSRIENYDKVIQSFKEETSEPMSGQDVFNNRWVIHHRLETRDLNGNPLDVLVSSPVLKARGLYYNRPASELIFLMEKDHYKEHWNVSNLEKQILMINESGQLYEYPVRKIYTDECIDLRDPDRTGISAADLMRVFHKYRKPKESDLIPLTKLRNKTSVILTI